jgi:HEAT repeat protein
VLHESKQALGDSKDPQALPYLLRQLDDPATIKTVIEALGKLGEKKTIVVFLDHPSSERRMDAVSALASMQNIEQEQRLLSRDFDALDPWIDPQEPITKARIKDAAQRLEITDQEARTLYESLAPDFHLKFA